jgi:hypothetical protein
MFISSIIQWSGRVTVFNSEEDWNKFHSKLASPPSPPTGVKNHVSPHELMSWKVKCKTVIFSLQYGCGVLSATQVEEDRFKGKWSILKTQLAANVMVDEWNVSVKHQWKHTERRKPMYSHKTYSTVTLSTTDLTLPGLGSILGLQSE